MNLKVNTYAVSKASNQIDVINRQIRDDISAVDSSMNALQRCWQGSASNVCRNKYNNIKRAYSDERYVAVNRFVTFLNNQVCEGYELSEKIITSAASAFN